MSASAKVLGSSLGIRLESELGSSLGILPKHAAERARAEQLIVKTDPGKFCVCVCVCVCVLRLENSVCSHGSLLRCFHHIQHLLRIPQHYFFWVGPCDSQESG